MIIASQLRSGKNQVDLAKMFDKIPHQAQQLLQA